MSTVTTRQRCSDDNTQRCQFHTPRTAHLVTGLQVQYVADNDIRDRNWHIVAVTNHTHTDLGTTASQVHLDKVPGIRP